LDTLLGQLHASSILRTQVLEIHCNVILQTYSQYSEGIFLDIVTYRPIARQRLGKHIPVGVNARNNRTSIARQRTSKHAFLTI
jgi:hypothetical protein